jgi:hypothetical protein
MLKVCASTVVKPADAQKVIRHSGVVYNKNELSFVLMKFGLPPNAVSQSPNGGHKSPGGGRQSPNVGCKSPVAGPKSHIADKSTESKKDAETEGELLSARDTIVVCGVTNDVECDLSNYLENTKRSGGGPVSTCDIDTSLGQALVTFSNAAGELGVTFFIGAVK